jgi:hypothetical protein
MNQSTSNGRTSVTQFLLQAIAASDKTYDQIANEVGLGKGTAIQMMTTGLIKLPIAKIKLMAEALSADPARLLGLVLAEYYPGLSDLVEELSGKTLLTVSERRLIQTLRSRTADGKAEAMVCPARDLIAVVMV